MMRNKILHTFLNDLQREQIRKLIKR